MGRKFRGRTITKETVSLGNAGEISRDEEFPEIPPEGRVKFQAEADFNNVKYHFLDSGSVKEALILTMDPKTFEVLSVTEKPKTEELPGMAETPEVPVEA
jgi:hypothetical protein